MGIVGYAPFPWLERKSLCFAWLHWYSLSVSTPLTLVKLTHITALDMVNYALLHFWPRKYDTLNRHTPRV